MHKVAPLHGSISYYRVEFYKANRKFKAEMDLVNDTMIQEMYVKFVDGIVAIKEDMAIPLTSTIGEEFSIFSDESRQVVVIKTQVFKDLALLKKIKRELSGERRVIVYFFFPNYDESSGDYESDANFRRVIQKELSVLDAADLHSIPKEYIRRMARGEFEL